MSKLTYPLTIVHDRYGGTYSGGSFTAWNETHSKLPIAITEDDVSCSEFWGKFRQGMFKNEFGSPLYVGFGETPEKALHNLMKLIIKHP